jgi:hypothetical protein
VYECPILWNFPKILRGWLAAPRKIVDFPEKLFKFAAVLRADGAPPRRAFSPTTHLRRIGGKAYSAVIPRSWRAAGWEESVSFLNQTRELSHRNRVARLVTM